MCFLECPSTSFCGEFSNNRLEIGFGHYFRSTIKVCEDVCLLIHVLRHLTLNTFGTLCSHLLKLLYVSQLLFHTSLGFEAWLKLYGLLNSILPRGSSVPSACMGSCVLSTVV